MLRKPPSVFSKRPKGEEIKRRDRVDDLNYTPNTDVAFKLLINDMRVNQCKEKIIR